MDFGSGTWMKYGIEVMETFTVCGMLRRSGQETGIYMASKLWKLRRSGVEKVRSGDRNIYGIEVNVRRSGQETGIYSIEVK